MHTCTSTNNGKFVTYQKRMREIGNLFGVAYTVKGGKLEIVDGVDSLPPEIEEEKGCCI